MRECFALVTLASLAVSSHAACGAVAEPAQIGTTDLSIAPQTTTNFNMAKLPERLRKLSGTTVVIHGYAYPALENEVESFVLTPETKRRPVRAFGGTIPIEFMIAVHMKSRTTFVYSDTDRVPIRVTGRLELIPVKDDEGVLYGLFNILEAIIERVPPRKGHTNSVFYGC